MIAILHEVWRKQSHRLSLSIIVLTGVVCGLMLGELTHLALGLAYLSV